MTQAVQEKQDRQEKTGLGNYFVANYPPFSFWKPAHLPEAEHALHAAPDPHTPLGLYLHIPFCRKRCKFCYFRVYTDKNARDVEVYLDALVKEVELYSRLPVVGGRPLDFVYFGGGTPSYLSAAQLSGLATRLQQLLPWDRAEEVTFECEPGTLQQHKLQTLKELGVTRLSLGIENFDDAILALNGRAHLSAEIHRSYGWARDLHFDQINIDLIAGMVGETWEKWRETVRKTVALAPDSVTVYQMELPFNTVFASGLRDQASALSEETQAVTSLTPDPRPLTPTFADWPTKRAWVSYAFDEFGKAGYKVSSAYTVVKDPSQCRFVYRDRLWHGADMFGTGVASFGHVHGVHVQNVDDWEHYVGTLARGELPLHRALPVGGRELLVREMILQIKTGHLERDYFRGKFGVDILQDFRPAFDNLQAEGQLDFTSERVWLTPQGLLQIDRLLPAFFLPEHQGARYT
jgi:oxygen-independent coproporphyrinogen-3 oxidase